jgi:hypothetical protein
LHRYSELQAILTDYLDDAERHQALPMRINAMDAGR